MTAKKPIRILKVDDHPVLREGIAAILASEPDMVLVCSPEADLQTILILKPCRFVVPPDC
jgi:DNA-binding NarL/FixJ family response regulator